MELSNFTEKLNKVDGNIYVIEEEAPLENGVYEAQLKHDNVNEATLAVYTGKKLTGEKVKTYTLSTPSLMPWKRVIRVYADVPSVFISYETKGDTVEAEDANLLQDAVVSTQKELNLEKERAVSEEKKLADQCSEESLRAETVEKELAGALKGEAERAHMAEEMLSERISEETARAVSQEIKLENQCREETVRAIAAEEEIRAGLTAETERAEIQENQMSIQISDEINRAMGVENVLENSLTAETERACGAEEEIRNTIEANRMIWEDKYSRSEVDNKFSVLETAIDWKEAVDSFEKLKEVYPSPEDGWTVNVKDTDYTYRWTGTEWVAISANSIPIATQELNGLLCKEDKRLFDDTNSKKHVHENISVLNQVEQGHLNKLRGIAEGAEVNVQSDWNAADTLSDAYIKNKPSSLPASGGNADTVNGHSVNADVPSGAKFTDTLYAVFKGAAAGADGGSGLVPAPSAGQQRRFLRADGTWQTPAEGDYVSKGATWKDLMGV